MTSARTEGPAPRAAAPEAAARPWIRAVLRNGAGTRIELLDNGAVFAIRHGPTLVNQVLGSPLTGSLGNLYLRRLTRAGAASFAPLLGPAASGSFEADPSGACWTGAFGDVAYACTLRLDDASATWFWTLELSNRGARAATLDAVLAADLGLADEALVRSSEAYASQYLDHTVLRHPELGVLLGSRQNLPQGGAHPWILHGCLDGAVSFATDAFQVHGVASRATGRPEALGRRRLSDRVLQYEAALPTLASPARRLEPGETMVISFFASFVPDHPAATGQADLADAEAAQRTFAALSTLPSPLAGTASDGGTNPGTGSDAGTVAGPGAGPDRSPNPAGASAARSRPRSPGVFDAPRLFASRDLDDARLERWFPGPWRHVERRDGRLLSFFHADGRHVVLRAKELATERAAGLILRSGRDLLPTDETLSVTSWMDGAFTSQLAVGNTSFNRLLGVVRDPLGIGRSSGQRVLVRSGGAWEQLGVPSAMEMAPGRARWVYEDDGRTITATVEVAPDGPACRLAIEVQRGGPAELLVTHEVVLGVNEHDDPGEIDLDGASGRAVLRPGPTSAMRRHYPDAAFVIAADDPSAVAAIGGDELLFEDGVARGSGILVVRTRPVTSFGLVLAGSLDGVAAASSAADELRRLAAAPEPDALTAATAGFWRTVTGDARLGGGRGRGAERIARLDDLFAWYTHDALIHVTAPHGLEQASGAAWGVRDVCQGPAELFLATRQAGALRELVLRVYARQRRRGADWPQWFMFDRYHEVQAPDAHGDVIVWPIKLLCDYLEATDDLAILHERIPWTDGETLAVTGEASTLLAHLEAQLGRLEADAIPGTTLPVFAGGDWEDTLQPVDPDAARHMVSTWTVALAFQSLGRLRVACERAGADELAARLARLCTGLLRDANRYLLPDGVAAGLASFGEGEIEYLLHPRDARTGVSYRLLPMTRGIIGGLFTPEQATAHAAIVERHLLFPDGARLHDRPMAYRGGPSTVFKRAESAANFGREIGLQYVHAHIRYVEAMAMLGRADDAFAGLLAVCPIGIAGEVSTALPRQANAYFSSSDGDFPDRYEARRRFDGLRDGRVGVRGGWRVYSSGPGIFLNQLVGNLLGLRDHYDRAVFDPVLPAEADGLTFEQDRDGRRVRYRYRLSGSGRPARTVRVNGRAMETAPWPNPYREGGVTVARPAFEAALDRPDNLVDIEA